MKKKILMVGLGLICSLFARSVSSPHFTENVAETEDSTQITTIQDIINTQTRVMATTSSDEHIQDVWRRKGYFNIQLTNASLSFKEAPTQSKDVSNLDFKNNIGISIQAGRNLVLHKTPIANLLRFSIDITPLDLSLSLYDKVGEGKYNSSDKFRLDGSEYHDRPWNLSKYQVSYNFLLGPSLTIHPFNFTSVQGLHHVSLNAYFHVGYGVSLFCMNSDKKSDLSSSFMDIKEMEDDFKGDFGHGLVTRFGLSLVWKSIGLGWETSSATQTYFSLNKNVYGDEKYKMTNKTNSIYLSIRF